MAGSNGSSAQPSVAIVGAGFGGIGMAIALKRAGIPFTIYERAAGVGGTWRDNTYPGLACDVPSHLYSFSFEPNHEWSRRFPPQPEILAYLERCADKYRLRPHIRFETDVKSAEFDAGRASWRISTSAGDEEANLLVAATGQLSRPAYPRLPGAEDFGGHSFHSADWDHDYDLTGKRVGVIGTGASAIQFVPEIASWVERLDVFQRSAPWVLRKPDRPFTSRERHLFRRHNWLQTASRWWVYWAFESRVLGFTKQRWILRPYERAFHSRLRREIFDPRVREKLTPDYPIGCKRVVISNDYLPTFNRPNVDLITEPIERITPTGVRTEDGIERELDTIIYGTGFSTHDFLAPMRVTGIGGRDLNEAWREGAEAYLGISVSGFPNMFILYGPNTNLGAGSIIYMLESQFRFVVEAIEALRRRGAAYLDLRPEAQAAFNAQIQRDLAGSVWQEGCRSWYVTESGRNTHNWPRLTFEYRQRTSSLELEDFRLETTSA